VIDETLFDAEEKMEKAVHVAREELGGLRTGRASPSSFARLVVDYYGTPTPIPQMATVTIPEPRMAVIKPYDISQLPAIEKAIRDSDLGMNPANDGQVIRLAFPPLTEERRKEYVKVVKHHAEDGRVAVRNVRRDARKHLEAAEKESKISANELERAERELEKITHDHIEEIDRALAKKEHELLEV
jgi:ribosome recycling factor